MNENDVRVAVTKAHQAQADWQALSYKKRATYILKAKDILLRDSDKIAALISKENGKPLMEAFAHDIMPVLDLMLYFSKNTEKLLARHKIHLGKWEFVGRRSYIDYYPYGVVGVIAPWNFPLSIPLGEVVMALMAGNTVVCKPSEYTPLVGNVMSDLFKEAGLPNDVFQVFQGDGAVGAHLVGAGCDKIVFTGSVNTGKKIMAACAKTLIPLTLELGGKDPMIVFEDADLDLASSAAVWGAFCNSGQICASVERVYVHKEVYDEFLSLIISKTKQLRQGEGVSESIDVGAMTAKMQLDKVNAQVQEAVQRGANILTGGCLNSKLSGLYFEPTILTEVDHSFTVVKDETFGPVMPVMPFDIEEQAVKLANDSEYALNAYIWGRDWVRNHRIAKKLIAGTVTINDSVFTHALPQTPWGGPKLSGMGRTHGEVGLKDLVRMRHVHENECVCKKKYFWWYPYSPEKITLFKNLSIAMYGKGLPRLKALFKYFKAMMKVRVS
ncbi:MAG: aldehyde dehydrogenase family protein [bacterium]|nr:aldehyde dehydrogenase family protein [bacterium]MBU1917108.1 aldehyde dehydrogenase family protein [bacterium]